MDNARRPLRVVIGGLPYFGRMLAELLNGDGWECRYLPSAGVRPWDWAATATALAGAGVVYLVGGQLERWSRPDLLLRFGRSPVVMHWVGSDVTYALAVARRGKLSQRLLKGPVHWAEAPWTAAELASLGVAAAIVPLVPARLPESVPPLPPRFTVLSYLPDSRAAFYGRDTVFALASALPQVRFLVAGGTGRAQTAPPNVEFLGWLTQMAPVYAESTVLLRLPEHDGLSFMVLEALTAGRHVIWNHPFEGVFKAYGASEAQRRIEWLLMEHQRGALGVNETGIRLMRDRYAPERVRDALRSRLSALFQR